MTAQTKATLKTYFNTGDIPTEVQFANLIDSFEMVENMPPTKNTAYTFYVGLDSQANTNILQANPTLAVGDVKVSIDGGALNNIATLPVVTPALSKVIKVDLSAAEMNGDRIVILFSDITGSEWQDRMFMISTVLA